VERLHRFLEALLLRSGIGPPLLDDLRFLVPRRKEIRHRGRAVQALASHAQLPLIVSGRLLDLAGGLRIDPLRQQLLKRGPELLKRLPRGLRIRTHTIPRRELDVLVRGDDREGGVQVLRLHTGLEERQHVGIPGRTRVRNEVAPGAIAEFLVLDLVQFGEGGRDAGLYWTFAQQSRTERVDSAGKEALQIAERGTQALDGGVRLAVRGSGFGARVSGEVAEFAELRFQRQMKAAPQFRRGFARERHGGEVLDLVIARRDARGHALGEHLCLA
jgi:hypothetical protein